MSAIPNAIVTPSVTEKKLRAIAKRVLHEFQVASEKAVATQAEPAAFRVPAEADVSERIFADRFKLLDADRRAAATRRVMALVKATPAQRKRYFGEMAQLDLRSQISISRQASALALPANLRLSAADLQALYPRVPPVPGGPVRAVTGRLALRIHKVRCVDETNPEWAGNDEIGLGGVGLDETGEVAKVPEFLVYNDFDDGDEKRYDPPLRFTTFSLQEGGNQWPKSYFVTLGLAEKDMGGGLDNFLRQLVDKVKQRLVEVLGAALGGVIGSLGGPLTAVVGAAVGYIVGKVYDWLRQWWNDDIFPPQTVSVTIGSLTHRWPGEATDSPEGMARFEAHGGKYDLSYDWAVFA